MSRVPIGVARFLIAWMVLAGTAVFLQGRSSFERIPDHQPLETFPHELGGWTGRDLPIDKEVLQVLGPGDFLSRAYSGASNAAPIDLFIAYYPSQRTGDTIHSPQNCMPGAGWTLLARDRIKIPNGASHGTTTSNRFVFAEGLEHVLVFYWYQAHGRTTPSEYWAKYYLVRDSIAMNRSDGAMVRVAAQLPNPSAEPQTEASVIEFSKIVLDKLDDFIPR